MLLFRYSCSKETLWICWPCSQQRSKCLISFPTAAFGEKPDYSNFERSTWTPRTVQEHRQKGREYLECATQSSQKTIEREHGEPEIEITGGHWSLSKLLVLMPTQVWICSDNIYYMMYIGGLANIPWTGQLFRQISFLISTSVQSIFPLAATVLCTKYSIAVVDSFYPLVRMCSEGYSSHLVCLWLVCLGAQSSLIVLDFMHG